MADYRRAEAILTSPLPPSQLPHPLPASQVGLLLDQEQDPAALPDCELENASAARDGSTLPLRPRAGGSKFTTTPAAGSKNAFSGQDIPRTGPSGRLEVVLERPPKLNMASHDSDLTGQQAIESQAVPMVDSSMACRYLATLCLVCLLAGHFCKS